MINAQSCPRRRGLSDGERYDEWRRVERHEVQVVVGARSAIFAPLENIGLIVIDEEHEATYKQEENPRYHARDVALWRAEYHNKQLSWSTALLQPGAMSMSRPTGIGRLSSEVNSTAFFLVTY